MGRLLSTLCRTALTAFAVSGAVLSVLTATSCAFVHFDHQYKAAGRQLLLAPEEAGGLEGPRPRALAEGDAEEGGDDAEEDSDAAAGDAAAGDEEEFLEGQMGVNIVEPEEGAGAEGDAGEGSDEVGEPSAAVTAATVFAPDRLDGMGSMAGFDDNKGDSAGEAGDAAADASTTVGSSSDTATSATVFAPDRLDGMGDMSGFNDNKGDSALDEDYSFSSTVGSASSSDTATSATQFAPGRLDGMGGMSGFKDNKGDSALNPENVPKTSETYGASQTYGTSQSSAVSKAAATAAGDAGLYCDGDKAFSVTNLWHKSVEEFAEDIEDETDRNDSEKLAQFASAVAAVFGIVVAFLALFTSFTGMRICCERWILGLVALCACVTQGLTFLFFNSDRYCDGDIINEILNQEPCVIGPGGIYSIAALLLYALVLVMSCKLPQDDPYAPCCKKRSAARNGGNDGGARTFVGSEKEAAGEDEEKPAQAPWLSEEKEKGENENEII